MSAVVRVVSGISAHDGAGVKINRIIGQPGFGDLDPFLLLDEFRSDDPDDYVAGFPDHPHRGFQTVTYMLAGKMRHQDNKGHSGVIGPGAVQWMHAGAGIVHSEKPEQVSGLMWGFQLWVNVPAKEKMTPAKYQEYAASEIPEVVISGGRIRVIAGTEPGGQVGPVSDISSKPIYFDVSLEPASRYEFTLPVGHNGFLYSYSGQIQIDDESMIYGPRQLIQIVSGREVVVTAYESDAAFLLITGMPINEPIARHGPFVMSNHDEIRAAIEDYRNGKF